MTKLIGNIQGWTQQCTNCHVMDDAGSDQGGAPVRRRVRSRRRSTQPVSLHFKKKYTEADIAPIARAQMEGILRFRRGETVPAAAAPAAAEAPAAVTPPTTPAAPAVPAATPATPAPAATTPAPATPAAAAPPRATAPAPFPARMVIDPAAPPAGSPTSIEPRFPIVLPATPAAAAPAPAAAQPGPAPVPSSPAGPAESLPIGYLSVGVLAVVAALAFFWLRGRKG